MADLHESRLADGEPPFTRTSLDYFGPLTVAQYRGREKKVWGALFTCLTTRAIYLDLAPSCSAEDFLLVLRRFISIYGKPKRIHSDNGTNFVGGEKALREEIDSLHASDELKAFLSAQQIDWTFQPARAPHFGGAHESLVRTTKKALYAALDQEKGILRIPTEDTLRTLLFEVAGLLNARPLTYVSADPEDDRPLTPNDFLNRPVADSLPAGDFSTALPQDRFRYVQRMLALFWDRWRNGYLQSLIARPKWQKAQQNLAVGDLVLEKDPGIGRGKWSLGQVVRVYPGTDGLVRAVDIKLDNGVFRRPIHQLVLFRSGSSASADSSATLATTDSGENGSAKSENVI
jgi:hypothetical protein